MCLICAFATGNVRPKGRPCGPRPGTPVRSARPTTFTGNAQTARLTPSHGRQLIRIFHIGAPGGFRDSRIDVPRLDSAKPFFVGRRTHNVDVPLRVCGHRADA
jgi:hypothetical protein